MRQGSTMDEAVKLIGSSVAKKEIGCIMKRRKRTAKVVQAGVQGTPADIGMSTFLSLAHTDKNAGNVLLVKSL